MRISQPARYSSQQGSAQGQYQPGHARGHARSDRLEPRTDAVQRIPECALSRIPQCSQAVRIMKASDANMRFDVYKRRDCEAELSRLPVCAYVGAFTERRVLVLHGYSVVLQSTVRASGLTGHPECAMVR